MSFTIFDNVYLVDGVPRRVWFRVPGTPSNPKPLPPDCVIWCHGGGQSGGTFMRHVPPRDDRIDVFPDALRTYGQSSGTYGAFTTNCTAPRAWVLPGQSLIPPFTSPGCVAGPVTAGSDPQVPQLVLHGILDVWTDLRFLCRVVRSVRAGTPPVHTYPVPLFSVGGLVPATWGAQADMRFWLAGFSKGGLLVLWAHAFNNNPLGIVGIAELADIQGYWISSAPMPEPGVPGVTYHSYADFSTLTPQQKICGYWHGGQAEDHRGTDALPGLTWAESADILKTWYGGLSATWSAWQGLISRGQVCTPTGTIGVLPGPYDGYVQTRYAYLTGAASPLPFRQYQVIAGQHEWTAQSTLGGPCVGAGPIPPVWDEALAATNLWRPPRGLYGT